jgi:hypothetical protein
MNLLVLPANAKANSKKLVIDLAMSSSQVINKINGQVATLPAGMTLSNTGDGYAAIFTAAHTGGITLPHDAKYAPGTGDFTIEAIIDIDGMYVEPADNSQIIPIASWGNWAAPGQSLNLDFFYNHLNGGGMAVGVYKLGVANYISKYGVGQLTQSRLVHVAVQRREGVLYFYQDGTLIHSAPYTTSITPDVSGLFRVMCRRGGGTGTVWWRFVGKLKGFRMAHTALYTGSTIVPPTKF